MNHRVLTLSDGCTAKVSARDFRRVIRLSWRHHPKGVIHEQVRRKAGRRVRTYTLLHRFIMQAKPGQVVIVRNGDLYDCRRENLQVLTKGEHNKTKKWSPRRAFFCGGVWSHPTKTRGKLYHYFRACFRGKYKQGKDRAALEDWVQAQRARDGRAIATDAFHAIHGEDAHLDHTDRARACHFSTTE